jgi:hypothetical protein
VKNIITRKSSEVKSGNYTLQVLRLLTTPNQFQRTVNFEKGDATDYVRGRGKSFGGSCRDLFERPHRYLPGATEETHKSFEFQHNCEEQLYNEKVEMNIQK